MEKHSFADGLKRTFEDLYELDGHIGELVNIISVSHSMGEVKFGLSQ